MSTANSQVAYANRTVERLDGTLQYTDVWQSTNGSTPDAVVCIVHGLGEHGGRYHPLAHALVDRGFSVCAFDQQGHGRDQNERGCVRSYDSLLDDVGSFLRWTSGEYEGLPIALLGHSMGGNLVLNYALRRELQPAVVISSSPMVKTVRPIGWLFAQLVRTLAKVLPNHRLKSEVRAERLMDDPVEQQLFESDELFHTYLSLRLAVGLVDSGSWLIESNRQLETPTLLMHSAEDVLTDPLASEQFAKKAGSLCEFQLLEGHLHDSFRDRKKDAVIDSMRDFIRLRVCT